ncbi:MAG: VOC family protein [Nitrososphaeraceae archaeon]
MSHKVSLLREGFHNLTPCLVVKDANKAIEFYTKVFGAQENYRNHAPDNKSIMYAELTIGDSKLILSDEFPEMDSLSPPTIGKSPVSIYVYVDDADRTFDRAVSEGSEVIMQMTDAFWGDRWGQLRDPFGHIWSIATHKKDVAPKDMEKAVKEQYANE